MEFERKTLPAQSYIYVERVCEYDGAKIAEAMGSAFCEVFGFLGANGITPLAMPMSVYNGMDPSILRFQGGVIISADDVKKAGDGFMVGELPAGDVMQVPHVGAYANLNQTHQTLWKHMESGGIPVAMPIWEIYVDDPGEVAEENLRTEIYRAIG